MKIYFLGAISGLSEHGDIYREIVSILKKLKHEVISDHVLERKPNANRKLEYPIKDDRDYYAHMRQTVFDCDFIVAEVTKMTPNIAYEIAYAVESDIPALCLCQNLPDVKPPLMIAANTNKNLVFQKYKKEDIERVLTDDLCYLKNLANSKYSTVLSDNIKCYLESVTKASKISTGLYIRRLLLKDMESHANKK